MENEIVKSGYGNYSIEQELNISGTRYFLAYDKKSKLPFMVGEKQLSDIVVRYDNLKVTDDYVTALDEWNKRIAEGIAELKKKRSEFSELRVLGKDDVEPVKYDMSIDKKVVVIKADCFLHESQYAQKQLYFVNGGFGAEANSRGRAIFCNSIFNGDNVRFNRQDVLGIIKADKIPEWAKERINRLQQENNAPITAPSAKIIRK